ncbi:MAG TPA: hypothetical protein PLV42_03180 [bacterium]|nr:hypothetical protein [bacterium]
MRHSERSAAALIIFLFSLILSAQSVYDPPQTVWDNLGTAQQPVVLIAGTIFDISLEQTGERIVYHDLMETVARSIMTPHTFIYYGFDRPALPPENPLLLIAVGTSYSSDAPPYLYADLAIYKAGTLIFDKRYSVVCDQCEGNALSSPRTADELLVRLTQLILTDRTLYAAASDATGAKTVPVPLPLMDPFRIITAPDFEPLIFPVFMTLNLRTLFGTTWVDIYDAKDTHSAAGIGTVFEEKVSVSFGDPESGWYLTPDIGFFYRRLITKDFAFDTSWVNREVDGFVPGVTRNDANGQFLEIFSLSYDSQFYSLFFGGHGGYQLIAGTSDFQITFHPGIYLNLLELRWTKFRSGQDLRKSVMRPYFFGSLGATLETGFFIPAIRTGLRLGTDISYFVKFRLPDDLSFKRVEYRQIELEPGRYVDLYLPEEFRVRYSQILSVLGYVDIYFVF